MTEIVQKIYTCCIRNQIFLGMKILSITLSIIFMATIKKSQSDQAINSNQQGIVAVVNTDIISKFDFIDRIRLVIFTSRLPNNQQTIKKISPQILRGLINEKLKIQKTNQLGITVTRDELKAATARVEKMNGLAKGRMRKILKEKGINFRSFELQVETQTAWRKAVVKQVLSTNKISEDLVDDAIKKIKLNKGKPEYNVAEIFIPIESGKSIQEFRQRAQRLYSQTQKGANFSELARAFSHSASAARGGNLGWIRSNQIDQELTSIMVGMKKNAISKPLKSGNGFYILRLLNKRISSGIPREKIKVTLEQLFLPLRLNSSETEVKIITAQAQNISSNIKTCMSLNKKGKELGSKQSGKITVNDISQLPLNIRNVVEKIEISRPSKPIRTNTGFLILMVCQRSGGGALKNTRTKIKNMLLQERAVIIDRRMLRNIRRSAFLEIRQ